VRLIASGGGAVYAPLGPTHLAVEDLAIMRSLPNMTVIAPCDAHEMKRLMRQTLSWPHPIYIRLGKGGDQIVSREELGFKIGKAIMLKEPGEGLFITTGVMSQIALQAVDLLEQQGLRCGVMHMHTIKPLDHEALKKWLPKIKRVVTVEEHSRIGGLGSAILEFCSDHLSEELPKISRVGIPDQFAKQYGSQNSLLASWGISVESLCNIMSLQLNKG